LRERTEDIEALAIEILKNLLEEMNLDKKGITKETINTLKKYSWPGNVRELRNILERAINLTPGKVISQKNLPERIINKIDNDKVGYTDSVGNLKNIMSQVEKDTIEKAL